MTDKQIEEKALKAYPPEYEQEDFDETWDMNEQYREPYIQALKEIETLPKISGWIARDEDGSVWFHYSKPSKDNGGYWISDLKTAPPMEIYNVELPNIAWEDPKPVEIELIFRIL